MSPILVLLALTESTTTKAHISPVLWLNLEGRVKIAGSFAQIGIRPGTAAVQVPGGVGWRFEGFRPGLSIPDQPVLAPGGSMTISCWVNPASLPGEGSGSQILFRGDDRDSLDPYTLVINPGGHIHFGICDSNGNRTDVSTPIELKRWTHIVAAYDAPLKELLIWKDGQLMSTKTTDIRPLKALDPTAAPGVGIGNVQWEKGRHNHPFSGMLADLRLYDRRLTPAMLGVGIAGWNAGWNALLAD